MITYWDRLRSGWGVVWCVKIEGINDVFCERVPDGLSGGTLHPDLVVDRSAEIGSLADRNTGIGAGLPFTLRLRDTAATRAAIRAPDAETVLSASITASTAPTITVESTADFTSSGTIWIGAEAITYTGKTAYTFTGCTRGEYGSRALPHTVTATAAIVSNRPRHWRGRLVELWAVLVTPDGTLDAAQAYTSGKCCWRGWVSTEPKRRSGGFELECLALDRLLSRPLAIGSSAQVISVGSAFPADPSFTVEIRATLYNSAGVAKHDYTIAFQPFEAAPSGTLLTTAEGHDLIQSAWAAALAATTDTISGATATTHFGNLYVYPIAPGTQPSAGTKVSLTNARWGIAAWANADASIQTRDLSVDIGNKHTFSWSLQGAETIYASGAAGLTDKDIWPLYWFHGGNPQNASAQGDPTELESATGVMVRLADITQAPPAAGNCKIGDKVYPYKSASQAGADWYLDGAAVPQTVIGQTATLESTTTGSYPDLMRWTLQSAGASLGYWDTLGSGNGYALPDTAFDESSFDGATGALALADAVLASAGGRSFSDMFAGALVLAQRAVCLREEGPQALHQCRIGLVSTEPHGSGYTDALDNESLVTVGTDGLEIVDVRDQPTQVVAKFAPLGEQQGLTVTVIDGPEVMVGGGASIDAALLSAATDTAVAISHVQSWAVSLLRIARTLQAVDVTLPPWRDIRLGGLVAVDLRHPDLWDAIAGTSSLSGFARVIGLKRNLKTQAVIATLLLADSSGGDLCPSMAVQSWTTSGGNVTSVRVTQAQAQLIWQAQQLTGLAAVTLLHTRPGCGDEYGGGSLSVTATATAGIASIDLTVNIDALTQPLDSTSELTFDALYSNDFTDAFCHVGDSHVWG